jgi:hypothetical protein
MIFVALQQHLMVNTESKEKLQMSEKIYKMLERLAEMFPKQDYQSRLERYIASRRPQSAGDVEFYEREFNQRQAGGFL